MRPAKVPDGPWIRPTGFEPGRLSGCGRSGARRIVNQWLRSSSRRRSSRPDTGAVPSSPTTSAVATRPVCGRGGHLDVLQVAEADLAQRLGHLGVGQADASTCAPARCRRRGRRPGAGTGPAGRRRSPPRCRPCARPRSSGRTSGRSRRRSGRRARAWRARPRRRRRLAGDAAVDLRAHVGVDVEDAVGAAAAQRVGARHDGLGLERLGRPARRHLGGDDALQVGLEPELVDGEHGAPVVAVQAQRAAVAAVADAVDRRCRGRRPTRRRSRARARAGGRACGRCACR